MQPKQNAVLEALFAEIELRHGKEKAEYFRTFYQNILNHHGAQYALDLLDDAEMRGKELSVRKAAKQAGVSHAAVIQLRKRQDKQ